MRIKSQLSTYFVHKCVFFNDKIIGVISTIADIKGMNNFGL